MKTYNTYAECKLANPDCDEVLVTGEEWEGVPNVKGKFTPAYKHGLGYSTSGNKTQLVIGKYAWIIANPADHLMTVEKFLTDGYKFVYSVLSEYKAKGLHYTLQCFTDYLSNDVGSLYKTPTNEEMGQAWAKVLSEVVPELGEVLITLEYR